MLRIPSLIVAAALFLSIASIALAADTPEEIAAQYYQHLKDQKWEAAAVLLEPAALASLKEFFLAMVESEGGSELLEPVFGAGMTIEDVRNLPGPVFFATFMQLFMDQSMGILMAFEGLEVLGSVSEGPDVVHVVTRARVSMHDIPITSNDVISLRMGPQGWGIMLSAEIDSVIQLLKAQLGQ